MRALLVPAAIAFVLLAAGAGAATAVIAGDDNEGRAITGEDVKDGSLTRADFRGALRGPAGPRGPTGAPGIGAGRLQRVAAFTDYGAGTPRIGHAMARCPAGKRVIGGGGKTEGSVSAVRESYPSTDLSRWVVNAIRPRAVGQWRVTAVAICVAR